MTFGQRRLTGHGGHLVFSPRGTGARVRLASWQLARQEEIPPHIAPILCRLTRRLTNENTPKAVVVITVVGVVVVVAIRGQQILGVVVVPRRTANHAKSSLAAASAGHQAAIVRRSDAGPRYFPPG